MDFRDHAGKFTTYVFAARELGEIRLPFLVESSCADLRFGDMVDDEIKIRVSVDKFDRLRQVFLENENVVDEIACR
mgnify:CR=1 FL=1